MNLPNRLTVARAIMVPFVVLFVWLGGGWRMAGLALFVIAGITDFCDGHIARGRGLVTDFGKFLDPLADKLLVICTMVTLCYLGECSLLLCIVVIIRELSVDGLRMLAASKGKVIAAGRMGKLKTTVQIVLLTWLMAFGPGTAALVLSVATGIVTVLSGAEYFQKNIDMLR